MKLPEVYVIVSQKEYRRLHKQFSGQEYVETGFWPQICIKGVPVFTQDQIRWFMKARKGER